MPHRHNRHLSSEGCVYIELTDYGSDNFTTDGDTLGFVEYSTLTAALLNNGYSTECAESDVKHPSPPPSPPNLDAPGTPTAPAAPPVATSRMSTEVAAALLVLGVCLLIVSVVNMAKLLKSTPPPASKPKTNTEGPLSLSTSMASSYRHRWKSIPLAPHGEKLIPLKI